MTKDDHIRAAHLEIAIAQSHLEIADEHLAEALPAEGVITDRDPRPLPALPVIEPGQVIVDPTFGSRILRVTGPDVIDQVVSYRSSDSTIQRAWNSTVTRFTVEDTYGQQIVFAFDAPTLRVRRLGVVKFDRRRESPKTPTPDVIVPFNGSDSAWHDTNPDRLYGRSGNKVIKVFDFSTSLMSTVVDLDTLGLNLPEESYTGGVCVMDDTLMTVCGGSVNDDNHYIVVGNLSAPSWVILDTLDLTQYNNGKGFLLHSTTMDLTARYILMVPSQKSGVPGGHLFIWDRANDAVHEITTAVSGHCALGRAVYVNQDCEPGTPWDAAQWTFREFSNPNMVTNTIDPVLQPKEVYLAEHPSWTSMETLADPFVTATYRYQVTDVPWRAWDEEVVTINVDSGEVRRQCHHRSQVLTANNSWDYWSTPRPNISPDGKYALFTSNWGRTLGTDSVEGGDRQDAFIVELR